MTNQSQNFKFRRLIRISDFKSGTTLIELLIYMGLLSIFLVVLTGVFSSIINTQLESKSVSSVEEDGRYILSRMTYDLRRASAISIPTSIGATSPTLRVTIEGSNYTYGLTGNALTLTSPQGTNNISSTDTEISDLSFTRIGNTGGKNTILVEFDITSATKRMGTEAESKTIQTTIGIR